MEFTVTFVVPEPRRNTYKVGDYFHVEGCEAGSRLVRTGYYKVCLIDPAGNYHMRPVEVADPMHVTDKDMRKLTLFPYELIGDDDE